MSHNQSLRGEQAKSQTRKKIAIAVSQTMSTDPKTIATASGVSVGTVRKNADHVAIIFAQETTNQQNKMKKIAHNNTDKLRYSVIQCGPRTKIIGHYETEADAEAARGRYLSKPWGSGVGPIVQIHTLAPGQFLS